LGRVDAFALGVATCLGVGCCPLAPGTAGAILGLPVALLFGLQPPGLAPLSVLALAALGVWAADRAETVLGRRDPPAVIVDEVVGMAVALLWVEPTFLTVASAFVLFRLGDIMKVPPGAWLERRAPGGLGVVADDVIAGIYANAGTRLIMMWVG
jgi:phosphatidylglycerophosphatase A